MQHGCHSAETYNGSVKFPKVKNRVLYMFPVSDARPTCTKHATDGATASKIAKTLRSGNRNPLAGDGIANIQANHYYCGLAVAIDKVLPLTSQCFDLTNL